MVDRQLSLECLGGLSIALVCLAFVLSCANGSTVRPSSRTHFIQIREQLSPQDLYVHVGDGVRWQNLRPDPVRVGLLSQPRLDLVSCEKGFTRFGTMQDTAIIQPREYVSICFSQPGTIQYNVWLNPDDPRGSMTPTAKIQISVLPTVRNKQREPGLNPTLNHVIRTTGNTVSSIVLAQLLMTDTRAHGKSDG